MIVRRTPATCEIVHRFARCIQRCAMAEDLGEVQRELLNRLAAWRWLNLHVANEDITHGERDDASRAAAVFAQSMQLDWFFLVTQWLRGQTIAQ